LIRAQPSERGDPWRLTTSIAAPLGVFFALYCAIAWTIGGAPDSSLDLRMAALPAAAGAASATACVGFSAYPAPGKTAVRAAPRDGVAALACVAILFLLAGMLGYREIRSDILSKLAAWSYKKGDADRALSFLERAAVLMPREKNHGLAIGTRRLEQVAVRLASPDTRAGGETDLDALLEQAEAPIRAAYSHAPRDPSAMLALANVLQFRALSILRPGIGAQRSEAAAAEARELFSLAHRRFPAHPLTLRNWAQFEFDQGNAARAFDLLDRLEAFDLRDPVSHAERLRMAAALGDPTLVEAALDRAARSLDADGMKELHKLLIQRK
jgi:hypothetical protein